MWPQPNWRYTVWCGTSREPKTVVHCLTVVPNDCTRPREKLAPVLRLLLGSGTKRNLLLILFTLRIGINGYIFWSSPWDYLLILNWLTSCSALFIWYLHIDGKTTISCRLPLQSVSGGCTMLLCSFIFDASTSILHAPCLHPRQNPRSQGVLTSSATRRFAGAWCSSAGFSGMRRPWNGDPEIIHGKPLVYHIYIYIYNWIYHE